MLHERMKDRKSNKAILLRITQHPSLDKWMEVKCDVPKLLESCWVKLHFMKYISFFTELLTDYYIFMKRLTIAEIQSYKVLYEVQF